MDEFVEANRMFMRPQFKEVFQEEGARRYPQIDNIFEEAKTAYTTYHMVIFGQYTFVHGCINANFYPQ